MGSAGTSARGVGTCGRCGKQCYRSRRDARAAKRAIHPGDKMGTYLCGSVWHVGHSDQWRLVTPDDLIWRPLPEIARAQIHAMAHPIGVAA